MSYRRDVWTCARAIYFDLSRGRPEWGFRELCELCEKHGGIPLPDPAISRREGALCVEGEILVSPQLDVGGYLEAIPHELVHRLADTPRWSWLNHLIEGWRYEKRAFREDVACIVGRLFVRAARRARRQKRIADARRSMSAAMRTEAVAKALRRELERLTGCELEQRDVLRAMTTWR